jgi:hypothetical protein
MTRAALAVEVVATPKLLEWKFKRHLGMGTLHTLITSKPIPIREILVYQHLVPTFGS